MSTRIKAGTVEIRTDMDLTYKQLRNLAHLVAGLAAALDTTEQPEAAAAIGFTAHLERLPDELPSLDPPEEDY